MYSNSSGDSVRQQLLEYLSVQLMEQLIYNRTEKQIGIKFAKRDMQTSLLFEKKSEVKGVTITPSRSELLNVWARSGSPTSLPMRLRLSPDGVGGWVGIVSIGFQFLNNRFSPLTSIPIWEHCLS